MFGRSSRRQSTNSPTLAAGRTTRRSGRRSIFHRTDPDRRAGGYKAALHNPNTTHKGRKHAKRELRLMGRGNEARGHPSLMSRIKHALGIRSRSSRTRSTRTKRNGGFGMSREY